MKNYSKSSTHKGRVAYRTPSRVLAGRPEAYKRRPNTKLKNTSWGAMIPPAPGASSWGK